MHIQKRGLSIGLLLTALLSSHTADAQSASQPIPSQEKIFAIIKDIQGNRMVIEAVHSVVSLDGENWLSVNEQIGATIEPLKPGNDRVAVCVDFIRNKGAAKLVNVSAAYPHDGCLGQLHDYEGGATGIPLKDIKPGTPVRIVLNGDLVLPKP